MNLELDVEATVLKAFLKRYPQAMTASIALSKDRVGYKLDAEAKRAAPAITGNLRRQIYYYSNAQGDSKVYAYANYSRYVHGAPYHENKMKRRETPFFTNAIKSSQSFIRAEGKLILTRVLK